MLQSFYQDVSEVDMQRQFGTGFGKSVMQLEQGKWHGPVLSGYGAHLVYVYSLQEAAPPVFEDVRTDVLANWQVEQREKFNADYLKNLKSRYEIVIADIPAGQLIESPAQRQIEDEAAAAAEPAS
jgi:parvulin-like peptidyl-prolyl isomerase